MASQSDLLKWPFNTSAPKLNCPNNHNNFPWEFFLKILFFGVSDPPHSSQYWPAFNHKGFQDFFRVNFGYFGLRNSLETHSFFWQIRFADSSSSGYLCLILPLFWTCNTHPWANFHTLTYCRRSIFRLTILHSWHACQYSTRSYFCIILIMIG